MIGNIDQLLHQPKAKTLLMQAERVLVIGGRLLSKRLVDYLAENKWKSYLQILPEQMRLDPRHNAKQIWHASIEALTALSWPRSSDANWALQLTLLNQGLETLFEQQIDNAEFGEAMIIRTVAKSQNKQQQLFIGNSLPIRLYDMFAPITMEQGTIFTNRGASGIDGLLATACGVAKHQGIVTTLIIGDISQLHDLNSLAIARTSISPLVIVILNNDGGNIFNLLPIPDDKLRNDYYRLAHGLEFGYGAAMFGLPYNRVEDLEGFIDAYQDAIGYHGTSVIEVIIGQEQASEQITRVANWIKQS